MQRSIRNKLLIAAGVALVVGGGAAWLTYHNAAQAAATADGADHVRRVLAASDGLLADLTEAGAARCGYIRSRDATRRDRSEEAMRAFPGRIDELRLLTAGDAEQGRRVEETGRRLAQFHDLLGASFAMRDDVRGRLNDRGQAALTQQIRETDAGVRGLLAEVKTVEGERLARGGDAARAAAGGTMAAVDLGNALLLMGTVLSVFVLRRDFLAWERTDRAGREAARRAESQAAEAAAALQAQATRQEEMGEECRRLEQLCTVGRLTTGVAHDFNNLLTVMMGGCEATLRLLPTDAPSRADLGDALKACEKATALSRRLLALSRKRPPQPAPLDLNAVVSDMERMLRRLIGEGFELDLALDPALRPATADAVRVEQILLNLVVNARDASAPGGRVRVETRPAGAQVELAVIDEGCGMDEATKVRMFEPFFTTKGDGKGTGLGLAVVLEAVRETGGFVEVDSAPGRGTAVRVRLPAAEPAPAATVLLVDPERRAGGLIQDTLRRFGHAVLVARDGDEALRTAEAHAGPIHLLVTEMGPPGMCGPELAARLLVTRPGLKVLYLTGDGPLPHLRVDAGRPGAAVLPRPYTLEIIGRTLREALGETAGR